MSRAALLLATLAAVMGALGVALAAAAAHKNGGELGRTASLFLIMHAVASLAVAAHGRAHHPAGPALLACGFLMEFGAALFAADLVARAFTGARLFPFAAPIGGSATIGAWIALAVAFGAACAAPPADAPTKPPEVG